MKTIRDTRATRNQKTKKPNYMPEMSIENTIYFLFIISIGIGTIYANLISSEQQQEIAVILEIFSNSTVTQTFIFTFTKYFKYHVLILVGGFIPKGVILSATIFVFRGISIGFTAGMMLVIYGFDGILYIINSFFLPNLFLVSGYFLAMYFVIEESFAMANKKNSGKHKPNNQYKKNASKFYFFTSILLILLGSLAEMIIY